MVEKPRFSVRRIDDIFVLDTPENDSINNNYLVVVHPDNPGRRQESVDFSNQTLAELKRHYSGNEQIPNKKLIGELVLVEHPLIGAPIIHPYSEKSLGE